MHSGSGGNGVLIMVLLQLHASLLQYYKTDPYHPKGDFNFLYFIFTPGFSTRLFPLRPLAKPSAKLKKFIERGGGTNNLVCCTKTN